jgi:hypothetical protein
MSGKVVAFRPDPFARLGMTRQGDPLATRVERLEATVERLEAERRRGQFEILHEPEMQERIHAAGYEVRPALSIVRNAG